MPDMEDINDTSTTPDSPAGGGTPPATPAGDASAAPGRALTTSSGPAPAATPTSTTPQTTTPEERAIKADSWGSKVYHGVLNALGGGGDVAYSRDPKTGAMVATPVSTSPGTQWKKIIAGALAGFGAAAAAGTTGPGGTLRGAGAGINAGINLARQRDAQGRQNADQDYEASQKAAVQSAQIAMLSHQITKSTFELGRAQVQGAADDAERESNFAKVIGDAGNGSVDMGVFPDFQAVMKAFQEVPDLHDHLAGGRIVAIPHINAKGQVDGIHAALVTPDWLNTKVNRDLPITVNTYKDGKLEQNSFTVPAGSLTGQQYANMVMAQSKEAIEDWTKVAGEKDKENRTRAENAQSYAGADKDRAEAKALNEATTSGAMQSNAQQLVEGTMDPANLSKRSKTYDATLAAANAYSMQKYGRPFDIAKASGDYKFATNVQTYNTLNYLNSLVGRDNTSGNLGSVIQLSDKLKRTDLPPINAVEQWAKLAAGNPDIAAYRSALIEVSDQVAKILQGGGSGNGTSDAKLKQAQELLDKNFNPKQMRATATELRVLLGNRKQEMIGDNRYLMQWHGVQGGGGAAPQNGAPGAAVKVQPGEPTAKGQDGSTLVVRNGQWVTAQP